MSETILTSAFAFWIGFWFYLSVLTYVNAHYTLRRKEMEKKGIKFTFWEKH